MALSPVQCAYSKCLINGMHCGLLGLSIQSEILIRGGDRVGECE